MSDSSAPNGFKRWYQENVYNRLRDFPMSGGGLKFCNAYFTIPEYEIKRLLSLAYQAGQKLQHTIKTTSYNLPRCRRCGGLMVLQTGDAIDTWKYVCGCGCTYNVS